MKISKPKTNLVFELLSKMIVPYMILENFDIYDVKETDEKWIVELREKSDRIPKALTGFSDIVLNGYCNSVEILSHSFVLKPVYLKIYRRRFKRAGEIISYDNTYDLHIQGLKVVSEMGAFFKI